MSISLYDISFFGSGNNNLGGPIFVYYTVNTLSGVPNSFFSAVSGSEARDGSVEHRCFYVRNDSDVNIDRFNIWIDNITGTGFYIELALGASPINGVEPEISDKSITPFDVYFSQPTASNPIYFSLPASSHKAIWIKRGINPGCPAQSGAKVRLKFSIEV